MYLSMNCIGDSLIAVNITVDRQQRIQVCQIPQTELACGGRIQCAARRWSRIEQPRQGIRGICAAQNGPLASEFKNASHSVHFYVFSLAPSPIIFLQGTFEIEDSIQAIDYLIKQSVNIDRSRLAIFGWSYGSCDYFPSWLSHAS